ncbi:MAG TPA: zinc ribbon domain-containing protein [candidate division Zixibacteria bacterium]|mgnify:FL=1|nr:zinc ribbon domain-containing protein [candidate division Zixibacteria bacterium]HPI32561.1 zinc ribbon domain-containing protein [candidate division Zixibacteria bacterium]HPM36630.1 zinc ribbon domain-containing protein [candidate division Zixibacteria bacterium]
MPLYEYKCLDCGKDFEELVSADQEEVPCPACGSQEASRRLSTFAWGSVAASCATPSGSGFR